MGIVRSVGSIDAVSAIRLLCDPVGRLCPLVQEDPPMLLLDAWENVQAFGHGLCHISLLGGFTLRL